ncbi:MAG: hypothetical protein GY811_13290 [Myxococcales bacterium]|nr:hypothetical protein [Myxococcales bacterium]
MAFKSSLILAPMLFAVACAGQTLGPEGDPTGPIEPSEPGSPEAIQQIAGEYEVTSVFDLRNSPDLPESVSDALGPLSGLADDPAGVIFDALEGTEVGDLLDSIPSALRGIVESQINDYIQEKLYEGVPVAGQIAEITDMVATLLTNFEVVSSLQVGTADDAGNATAEHSLTAIAYPQDGQRHVVAVPVIISALAVARDVSLNVNLDTNNINFGDHALELPLGDFAVIAFHAALESQFGITDLGAALGEMVDCDDLAADVGDIEVAGFTLVNEGQLARFCEQGLEKAAEQVDDQIRKLEMASLRFAGGDGTLSMESKADGLGSTQLDAIEGNWQSELGINNSGFAAPSSFKAVREN